MTGVSTGVAALMALTLAGCSPGGSAGLADGDIRKALADMLDRPSCFTDVEFTAFPMEPSTAMGGKDHPNFEALVAAGLATKAGKVYALSPAGKAAFDAKRKGFCYSAGHEIVKVLDVTAIPHDQLGLDADKAWRVTLSIAQKPVAGWVRTPAILKRARDRDDLSTEPRTYHVTLAHERGVEGIRRRDALFDLSSGFS